MIAKKQDIDIDMAVLNFTLTPEALGKLHDALVCLGKFSEAVSIEAKHDKVRLGMSAEARKISY